MLIVCWRSINPLTIFRRLIVTELLFSVSINNLNSLNVAYIFLHENEGLAPLARTFLWVFAFQYVFFSLGAYPYLLCALLHANTMTVKALMRCFHDSTLFCELVGGSLSPCFIYQDIRLEIWNHFLKLCMIQSLKTGNIRLFFYFTFWYFLITYYMKMWFLFWSGNIKMLNKKNYSVTRF